MSRSGLRVIATRRAECRWSGGPLLVIAVDVNSLNGFSVLAFAFDERVRLIYRRCLKPPNTFFLKARKKVRGAEEILEALQERLKQHSRALAPRLA